jgi:hypothetical protein
MPIGELITWLQLVGDPRLSGALGGVRCARVGCTGAGVQDPASYPAGAVGSEEAAERWIAKNPLEPYRDIIRIWGLLAHRPPAQKSWPGAARGRWGAALAGASVVGVRDIRVRGTPQRALMI